MANVPAPTPVVTDVFASARGKSEPTHANVQAVIDRMLERAPQDSQLRWASWEEARHLDPAMLQKLAADYLFEKAKDKRRAQVLRIENEAVREKTAAAQETSRWTKRPRVGTAAHRRWLEASEFNRERERRIQADEVAAMSDLMGALKSSLETYTSAIRMEWTQELLGSEFALPNGERVTWGEATVEQHEQRLQMFMDKAAANLEGAARHRKALDELEKMGAQNLNALVGVAA